MISWTPLVGLAGVSTVFMIFFVARWLRKRRRQLRGQ